ncbi:MAG: cobyrinic acid a,c-diamide synthase [Actinophytocola sp.]|uniref:cobyrinic acid a,c-diamide synthase n=1 Tax=Actinophytocola sp. TaxID=1872138 RepID=UPI001321050B|nr:cobyrinic acid a,c-diamide synthase [Actinophytocola sp.]MPZ85518.1 cobyrinic acid a,c-diamide synthase [Actinophytocola sp.]
MNRRASLPGAAELFRPTAPTDRPDEGWLDGGRPAPANHHAAHHAAPGPRRGTPRQKHTSKITVYVSDEELLALEHARLALRAMHGLIVDRGRVVREAIAVVLADLEERGEDAVLVRRLRHDSADRAAGK